MAEEAMLAHAASVATKRVLAWQIAREIKAQRRTKTAVAQRMRTSLALPILSVTTIIKTPIGFDSSTHLTPLRMRGLDPSLLAASSA